MLIKPLDHNPDLKKLVDEGLEIEILSDCILVKGIPYLNQSGLTKLGTLVSSFSRKGNTLVPRDHTCSLIEGIPYNDKGAQLVEFFPQGRIFQKSYSFGIAQCYMSCKPQRNRKYKNFYQKFKKYISLISRYVPYYDSYLAIRSNTKRTIEIDSVFYKNNTSDIESGIQDITYKLKGKKIAIIGVGGTGSFVTDYICKTEVSEIHIFDSDIMKQKNLFRIPGYSPEELIPMEISKVEYIEKKYQKLRTGVYPHPFNMSLDKVHLLDNMDFVFVCIDKTIVKKIIFEYLKKKDIPFVDVGMGLSRVGLDAILRGQLRTTIGFKDKYDHVVSLYSDVEVEDDDEYSKNIQIIELNALNASVIKMKKYFNIYQNSKMFGTSVFKIGSEKIINENNT
jgi:molybdopterin/thiamine biosynthesis adenylyltransferase